MNLQKISSKIFILTVVICTCCFNQPSSAWAKLKQTAATATTTRQTLKNSMFGVDITQAQNMSYDTAFSVAHSAGTNIVQLPITWDDTEKIEGQYKNEFLNIANSYYPSKGVKIALVVAVIDTNQLRLPTYLNGKSFDDPVVIDRFNKLIDYVLSQLPNSQLASISIGNEVDSYLANDQTAWQAYTRFYNATKLHVNQIKPGVPVGVKATMYGLIQLHKSELQQLNLNSDVIQVTYYPVNADFTAKPISAVSADIKSLTTVYPSKMIQFLEIGYPSSTALGSSQQQQSNLVTEFFKVRDANASRINLINFTWLHDKSPQEVSQAAGYYKLSSNNFQAFIGSLGLRTYDGKDKTAFSTLWVEAQSRLQ